MEKRTYSIRQPFRFECGKILPEIDICYHTNLPENHILEDREVIWICHALTANSNPEEWWDTMVGKGKPFDTNKYYIICANMLGSCYGTTGPDSNDPRNNHPYLFNFPIVSIRDMVAAHELLRKHLGIEKIDLLIGGSSGGFQAVEWAVANPELISKLCLIACGAKVSPWATALNESQRMALEADESFRHPDCCKNTEMSAGSRGLAAARSIALLSYRSYQGYCLTQQEDNPDFFEAERASSYQRYQGKKLVDRFNPYSYYYLTRSVDTHNVERGRGIDALGKITAKTLCIGIETDILFPLSEIEYMAKRIPNAHMEIIHSDFGHDGFLLEYKQLTEKICKYLSLEEAL